MRKVVIEQKAMHMGFLWLKARRADGKVLWTPASVVRGADVSAMPMSALPAYVKADPRVRKNQAALRAVAEL